jgi:hypothetical protein
VGGREIFQGEGFKIENSDGVSGGGGVLGREGACGEEAKECSSGKGHGSLLMIWRIGVAGGGAKIRHATRASITSRADFKVSVPGDARARILRA